MAYENFLEKTVFRKHFGSLSQCLTQQEDLIPLVVQFYSEGIIGEQLRNHILESSGMNGQQRAVKFLSAVERYIADNPGSIHTVIQLLLDNGPACKYAADAMHLAMTSPEEAARYCPSVLGDEKFARLNHQSSFFEEDPTDVHAFRRGGSVELHETGPSTTHQRAPLMKHSTFPQYHADSAAFQLSTLSLTEGRDRSHSFPADVNSPTQSTVEGLFTTQSSVQLVNNSTFAQPHRQVTDPHTSTVQPSATTQQTNQSITKPPTLNTTSSEDQEATPPNDITTEPRVHLKCEVLNAETLKPIKYTTLTSQNSPLFRNIKLKVKKYSTVSPNTPLQLQITADRACYVYVINIGSSGDETIMIPNEFDTKNFLEENAQLIFPSPGAEYEFELDENCGKETLVLLAYGRPPEEGEQALRDCQSLRTRVGLESTSEPLFRGIKIKPKQSKRAAILGFLEIQFVVST